MNTRETIRVMERMPGVKAKKLRRNSIVPAILCGKNYVPSKQLQIQQYDAEMFMKTNAVGSKAILCIGDEQLPAILKEVPRDLSGHIEHMCFMQLVSDEKITGKVQISIKNRDLVPGVVNHLCFEAEYKSLPAHMVEKVEIDLEGMKPGDKLELADIHEINNDNIELITPLDTLVVMIEPKQLG